MTEDDRRPDAAPAGAPQDVARLGRIVGNVVAPTTLVVGLMVYLSALRLNTYYRRLGVDYAILNLSVQDYLLQSANIAFEFLVGLLVAVLILAWVYLRVTPYFERHGRTARWTARVLGVLGVVGLLVGLTELMGLTSRLPFVGAPLGAALGDRGVPLGIGGGLLTLAYAAVLRRLAGAPAPAAPAPIRITLRVVYLAVLVLMLLWFAGNFARERGAQQAETNKTVISVFPVAVLYSPTRMHLQGAGVTETRLAAQDAGVRYRYDGLRLVAHAHGVYVLLPQCWAQTPGARAVVLHDDAALRLEFSPVVEPPACPAPPVRGVPGAGTGG